MDKPKFRKFKQDVYVICDYLHEEEKHYEESGKPRDHIWCYVRRMQRWLKTA